MAFNSISSSEIKLPTDVSTNLTKTLSNKPNPMSSSRSHRRHLFRHYSRSSLCHLPMGSYCHPTRRAGMRPRNTFFKSSRDTKLCARSKCKISSYILFLEFSPLRFQFCQILLSPQRLHYHVKVFSEISLNFKIN